METFKAFNENKSLSAWSRDRRCCVPYLTLQQRVEDGWDIELALRTPGIRNLQRLDRDIAAFGQLKSLVDWAADPRAKAPATTILWRIRRGWSTKDAITTPAALIAPKADERKRPELYEAFGKTNTLRGWLEDPRCRVRREKLLRNLKKGMSMEDALTHSERDPVKKAKVMDSSQETVDSIDAALQILSKGGEVWQVHHDDESRISILRGNTRYELENRTLDTLVSKRFVNLVFNTDSIHQYAISDIGRQAALA